MKTSITVDYTTFNNKIKKINESLDNGYLSISIEMIRNFVSELTVAGMDVSGFRDDVEQIASSYSYMLRYAMEGMPDPNRNRMRKDMTDSLYMLTYRLRNLVDNYAGNTDSYSMYAVSQDSVKNLDFNQEVNAYLNLVRRVAMSEGDINTSYALTQRSDALLKNIFLKVWTSYPLTHSMQDSLATILMDDEVADDLRLQIVSALTLLLTRVYDSRAMRLLIDTASSTPDQRLAAKALVGAVVSLLAHNKIARHDNALQLKLNELSTDAEFVKHISEVIQNLAATRETESINRAIHDEILPELTRTRADIVSGLKDQLKNGDYEDLEENPMWQKLMEDKSLSDKLKQLSDWQMEGADVMMSAFGELKKSQFFRSPENWFIPFNPLRMAGYVANAQEIDGLMPILDADVYMCDSDKYSFLSALIMMPAMQRKMISSQLEAQMSQIREENENTLSMMLATTMDKEICKTVRNLFRFFRQYERRKEFSDPFSKGFDINALDAVPGMGDNRKLLTALAEFFMTRGFCKDAAVIYDRLMEGASQQEQEMYMQKLGYCHQKSRNFNSAIDAYSRAEMINGESKWLLRQIAFCYKSVGNYDKAAKYYELALGKDPDNVKLILNMANCLLETGEFEKALKLYFKADYISPDNLGVLRPMAWCLLMLGREGDSADKYEKILAQDVTPEDLTSYGHLKLKTGKLKQAVDLYTKAIANSNDGYSRFVKNLNQDKKLLTQLGIEDEILEIIPDLVHYTASGN